VSAKTWRAAGLTGQLGHHQVQLRPKLSKDERPQKTAGDHGDYPVRERKEKKRKEKFTLFSDHNGSLLRRQPGAMTIGHSPKGKENS